MKSPESTHPHHKQPLESVIATALKGLRYGSVEITIHDARVVQIERKEKFRPDEAGFRATLE